MHCFTTKSVIILVRLAISRTTSLFLPQRCSPEERFIIDQALAVTRGAGSNGEEPKEEAVR